MALQDTDTIANDTTVSPRRHRRLLAAGLAKIVDLIMPPICLSCQTRLDGLDALCPSCWSGISFIRPPICDCLGLPMPFDTGGRMVSAAASATPPAYDRARAVASFDGLMRDLVHDLKFRDRHDLRHLLGRWLSETGQDILVGADMIVPVPLGRLRLLQRGFNQSAILAQDVARTAGLPFEPLILTRTRKTRPQVGLTRLERLKNVSGAFVVPEVRRQAVAGRNVVLIDDVITTGATVGACARALKRAGAARVDVLALALVTGTGLVPG